MSRLRIITIGYEGTTVGEFVAALKGDRAGATQIDQRLVALHRNLFVETNPIPVKWAVARMGLIGDTLRLPLTELSPEYHSIVSESLFAAGISV